MSNSIWIGWEPREAAAFAVAQSTIRKHLTQPIPIYGVVLNMLRKEGLYTREHTRNNGQLWDVLSDAPMATEFACSRFLVPHLVKRQWPIARNRWAVFMDCDMMIRGNLVNLFKQADPKYAVMVVKHEHNPSELIKMDNQIQTRYSRKNWSSVMMFNCDHPANEKLTPELVNSVPGRDLHGFCWLQDEEIGELDPKWNYLVGHTDPLVDPVIVHHTDGIPMMEGYENAEYADEWWQALEDWAKRG